MNDPKRIIVVLLGLIVIGMGALGIKGHMDSNGYKNQVNYTTAIQSTKQDDFNYIVDSQQGRVLANGDFKAKGAPAKFDEMNKGYTYVHRSKEHYTMHTREVCSGSGKTESCHTEIYYTWDEVSSDVAEVSQLTFMGRDYPTALFDFGDYNHGTSCTEFAPAGTNGFFKGSKGCVDGDFYITDDDRYVYSTTPLSFNASFLATTYGGLKPFESNSIKLENKSIGQILKDVGKYQLISFWVVTVLLIFLVIGAGFAAYAWVFEDGVWSLEE